MTEKETQIVADALVQQIKDARTLFGWALEHNKIDSIEDSFNWIAQIAHSSLRHVDPTLPPVDPTRPRIEFVHVEEIIA